MDWTKDIVLDHGLLMIPVHVPGRSEGIGMGSGNILPGLDATVPVAPATSKPPHARECRILRAPEISGRLSRLKG